MNDLIARLRAVQAKPLGIVFDPPPHPLCKEAADALEQLQQRAEAAEAELARVKLALHEICEEWAGAECGEPVHAQEAYAIGLAKRMYKIAAAAMQGGK